MKQLVLVVLVLFAACDDSGGSGSKAKVEQEKPKPKTPGEEILGKMEEFKDAACRCKDLVCAEKVESDMMEWAMKNMEKMKDLKPTKEEDERAGKISEAMQACKEKLRPAEPAPTELAPTPTELAPTPTELAPTPTEPAPPAQ